MGSQSLGAISHPAKYYCFPARLPLPRCWRTRAHMAIILNSSPSLFIRWISWKESNNFSVCLEFSGAKRTFRPRIMTKATVTMQTAAIKGQLLSIGIGSADGPKGIIVPRLSQFVSHGSPDVPPKVEAAAGPESKSFLWDLARR